MRFTILSLPCSPGLKIYFFPFEEYLLILFQNAKLYVEWNSAALRPQVFRNANIYIHFCANGNVNRKIILLCSHFCFSSKLILQDKNTGQYKMQATECSPIRHLLPEFSENTTGAYFPKIGFQLLFFCPKIRPGAFNFFLKKFFLKFFYLLKPS